MNILGGKFQWGPGGYSNGPIGHQGTSWKTENAWDLMTTPDTEVYSITDGVVTKIKSPKTNDSHLFGASIEVLGRGENPTVFYCNLSGIKVRVGSKVSVGEKLGKVATAPNRGESFLHVALPVGKSITSLVSSTGEIYTKTSKEPIVKKVEEPKTKDSVKKADSDTSGDIYSKIAKVLTPIALGGALLEEVDKIKKLMK